MYQSQLFTKTRREAPADENAKSAQLLMRAGFVHKEMAGVYAMLPLGLRVMKRIVGVVRKHMNGIGGQEVELTALQDPEVWDKTGRWSDQAVDNWFKTKLKNGSEVGLSFTHEEPLARIMRGFVGSYRDLPAFVYQFQTKFRNELRSKSGLLRGREFLMKDLYSFTATAKDLDAFYDLAAEAYRKIFDEVGIGSSTYMTFASGGIFSKFSHEFQTVTEAGEDTIYVARGKGIAVNKEVYGPEVLKQLDLKPSELEEVKAIEVGNIFKLGTRYSEPLGLTFADQNGETKPVVMGSYGIGIGRLMATIVETKADAKGMVWPATVAPFDVHVIGLNPRKSENIQTQVQAVTRAFESAGREVLVDDRDASAGEKFADSDLVGIPKQVVVSEKTLAKDMVEIRDRATGHVEYVNVADAAVRE